MNYKEQTPCVIWFTGLSGSGKSTLANALEKELTARGHHTYVLDGDKIRKGLNKDLTFTPSDRSENIRRISETAALFLDAKVNVIGAFISPYEKDRLLVKQRAGSDNYIEVYVSTPIEICEARDVKGFYKKARNGEIKNFTGISAPYEAPVNATFEIDTSILDVSEAIQIILKYILKKMNSTV
ncbi:adenylyl-sulfate kinase [Spongiimicrobium salis]|uniref:adenylyl-sulfate kinase n=1 Tax=Spongiimicrobium salis TaxID=1667022 RepID=UPI00374CC67C